MNEAPYDEVNSPAQMCDPLNTTNSESKYIKLGMKQFVTIDQEIWTLGNFRILNSCAFYFAIWQSGENFTVYN